MSRSRRGGCSSASAMSCWRRAASRSTNSCSCNDRPWRACQAGLRSKGVRLWRPNSTPTPRAVVCGRTHPPSAFCSLAKPTIWRKSSGRRSDWTNPKVTGRPERRDTSPIQAISARVPARSSPSRSPRREAVSKMPRRCRPSTSAKAKSSSGVAHVPGTGRPSGMVWSSVREVENPSAPASMASSTSCVIAVMSSSVAGVSSRLRSPMAWWRTAQWPTIPPTFGPLGRRPIEPRYSP